MPEVWHSRIKITQLPQEIGEESITLETDGPRTIKKTWMYDILSDRSVYGLEMTCNNHFSMTFIKKASSEMEAEIQGENLLDSLKIKFPGLTGIPSQMPIRQGIFKTDHPIFELKLPYPSLGAKKSFSILQNLVFLFNKIKNQTLVFYIFWQRDDSIETQLIRNFPDQSFYDTYKVKIFVTTILNSFDENRRINDLRQFRQYINIFELGLANIYCEKAEIVKSPRNTWRNIWLFDVFYENKPGNYVKTGKKYSLISHEIPDAKLPSFLNPEQVDFTFLSELPLPKAFVLEKENVNFLGMSSKSNGIRIGKYISNGVPTNKDKIIDLDDFSQSAVIFGQPGTGKTSLLGLISRDLHDNKSGIGVLYLNLGKGNQEGFYSVDRIIKYGSLELKIPYYVTENSQDKKSLQETATYLISSLGLKDPVDKVLLIVMDYFIRVNGTLPKSLEMLFGGLRKWYEENEYHDEYQTNILRAIDNRILSLLTDPILDRTLELSPDSAGPKWFKEWRAGKKIYIDLSTCNIYVKRLLSNAIFQIVRTLTPDIDVESLCNIIVIDEAHQILERPVINNPYDDDYIAREQLEKIFNILIREFRGKGLAFILADQTPHLLFDCVSMLPSLKILFRLGFHSSKLFSSDLKELNLIQFQKNREAIIFNSVNAERYVVETLDYFPKKPLYLANKKKKGAYIE